jgi:hypothetical protein
MPNQVPYRIYCIYDVKSTKIRREICTLWVVFFCLDTAQYLKRFLEEKRTFTARYGIGMFEI